MAPPQVQVTPPPPLPSPCCVFDPNAVFLGGGVVLDWVFLERACVVEWITAVFHGGGVHAMVGSVLFFYIYLCRNFVSTDGREGEFMCAAQTTPNPP